MLFWRFYIVTTGKLYDQCQDTLVQFGTFLGSTMTVDEYVRRLPSIHSMLQDNHIHSDVAFFLARPMFAHAINVSRYLHAYLNLYRCLCTSSDKILKKSSIEWIILFRIISKIFKLILKVALFYSLPLSMMHFYGFLRACALSRLKILTNVSIFHQISNEVSLGPS